MYKLVVFFALVAAASANTGLWNAGLVAPGLGWGSPLVSTYAAAPAVASIATPLVSNVVSAPVVGSELALPHGVPAVVTRASGTPLDTADVVVARNNHLVAKSLVAHRIYKRSAPWGAPLAVATPLAAPISPVWSTPVVSTAVVSPLAARTIVSPIAPLGLHSIHKRSAVAPWGSAWGVAPLARSAVVAPVVSSWGARSLGATAWGNGAWGNGAWAGRTWGAHAW